jgi:hypothetical protein
VTNATQQRRREAGSALFVAVMMLVLMGFLGLAALDRVTRDGQVAGFQNRSRTAFYAAEAGIAEARSIISKSSNVPNVESVPAFPDVNTPRSVGDSGLYDREDGNLPRYYGDPSTGKPAIRWASKGKGGGAFGMNLQANQGSIDEMLWLINVVGESPDGSRARIEVLASVMMKSGSY